MDAMVAHFAVASAKLIAIAGFTVPSGTTWALGVKLVSCVYSMLPELTGNVGMSSRRRSGNCAGPQMRCGKYSVGEMPVIGAAAFRLGGRRSSQAKLELRPRTLFA